MVEATSRLYTTKRRAIADAISEKLKEINGTENYLTDLANNVLPKLQFWDEIEEFPAVHVSAGREVREYQAAGYKDRFLSITIRCYVRGEDAPVLLEYLLEDVETIIEENSRLAYQTPQGGTQFTHDMTIQSIDTDEGVLSPIGVGEILIQVHY
jgi:hypothetical protein